MYRNWSDQYCSNKHTDEREKESDRRRPTHRLSGREECRARGCYAQLGAEWRGVKAVMQVQPDKIVTRLH